LNLEKLTLFNNTVTGQSCNLSHDWYIRDGFLKVLIRNPTEKQFNKERHLWLISNTLIITKFTWRKKEQVIKKIELDFDTMIECRGELEFDISFTNDLNIYQITCSSLAIRNQWVYDIKHVIETKSHKSPRSRLLVLTDHNTRTGRKSRKQTAQRDKFKTKSLSQQNMAKSNKTIRKEPSENHDVIIEEKKPFLSKSTILVERDTFTLMTLELTRLREEGSQFKKDREEWLNREASLTERIRFLESQLCRASLFPPTDDSNPLPELQEYKYLSSQLKQILTQLDQKLLSLSPSQMHISGEN